jgi:hypothetical protein
MIWRGVAAMWIALGPLQDPVLDRIVTAAGEELRGEIVRIDPDGSLVVKTAKGSQTVPLDDVRRIQFEEKPQSAIDKTGEKLLPKFGGALTGAIVSIDADRVTIKCAHGTYAVKRDEVRAVSLGEVRGQPKEIKEDQDLLILAPDSEKPGEPVAVSGGLESLDAERAKVGGVDYPRAKIREIRFRRRQGSEPSAGLFARILMKNGDGLVGTLRKVEAGRVLLFTHYAGVASIEKSAIHSIAMVPLARLQFGNLLVCDSAGVMDIDRGGTRIWTYGNEAVGCTSARKLANGNVLIANGNQGTVFEVRPSGVAGGKVVWTMDSLSTPWHAQGLENGDVLVAEYGTSRIVEYDPRDKSIKWSASLNGSPTGVERLDDGGTLVSFNQGPAAELDAKGAVRTRYLIGGRNNEYRAARTAEGTTMIADQRGMNVFEVDQKNTVIWKYETPQPRMAIRLDDGHTMIMLRSGKIIKVDERGQTVQTYGPFSGAGAFSVY